jgi:hypothetical protein
MGRINELIISIQTMNGTKATGVPSGTKWASTEEKFLTSLKPIIPDHSIILKGKVNLICLVLVKTKGHRPMKFLTAKVMNSATPANLTELPATLPFTRPISSESPFAKEETLLKLRLETTQEEDGIKHTATHLTQLIFTPIPVLGSKVLNNLLILIIIINYLVFRVLKFKILYDYTPW